MEIDLLMKILHITPTFYPAVGGIETVVRDLMLNLQQRGFISDAMHIAPGNQQKQECLDGSTVWRVPLFPNRLIGLSPPIRSILSQYDILHVHDPQLMAISLNVFLYNPGKPTVLSTHGGYLHTAKYGPIKTLHWKLAAPLILNRYSRILASSHSDWEWFKDRNPHAMLVPNGVSVEKFSSVEHAAVADPTRWIYWGRLSQNKRLDILIDTVAQLRATGITVDLLIAGADFDGLLPSLLAKIDRLRLRSQLRLTGQLSDAELLHHMSTRSIFVTASDHEGFGVSIIEAMAAGLIVICRDIAPLNAFVSPGKNGLLLKFDRGPSDLSLMKNLCETSADDLLQMRKNAITTAVSFSWKTAIQRYIDVYMTLSNGAHKNLSAHLSTSTQDSKTNRSF